MKFRLKKSGLFLIAVLILMVGFSTIKIVDTKNLGKAEFACGGILQAMSGSIPELNSLELSGVEDVKDGWFVIFTDGFAIAKYRDVVFNGLGDDNNFVCYINKPAVSERTLSKIWLAKDSKMTAEPFFRAGFYPVVVEWFESDEETQRHLILWSSKTVSFPDFLSNQQNDEK